MPETPEPQSVRECGKAREECQKLMRADLAAGVGSFHEALAGHRVELREERKQDRQEQHTAFTRMSDDLKGTLGRIERSVTDVAEESADTRLALGVVDARSKSNTHRLNWLWRVLGVVVGGLLLAGITGGVLVYFGWLKGA